MRAGCAIAYSDLKNEAKILAAILHGKAKVNYFSLLMPCGTWPVATC